MTQRTRGSSSSRLSHAETTHPIAIVSGVLPTDTRLEAAEKALETMIELFGAGHRQVRRAQRMLEQYRERERTQ